MKKISLFDLKILFFFFVPFRIRDNSDVEELVGAWRCTTGEETQREKNGTIADGRHDAENEVTALHTRR